MQILSVQILTITCLSNVAERAENSRLVIRPAGQFENANTLVRSLYFASRE